MTVGYAIEAPSVHELDAACRKVNRLLQRAEADMNVGLSLIDDQKTFESDLETLLETLKEYTDCRIHEMRLSEPPLTDIRFETRIYKVQTAFENISNMIARLIRDVQTLHEIVDPRFDTAAVTCLIKAETVMDEVRKIIVRERNEGAGALFFISDWN